MRWPPHESGAGSRLRCVAAMAVLAAFGPRPDREHQDPDPRVRAALLRASVILKMAPYLTADGRPPRPPDAAYRIALVGKDDVVEVAATYLPGKSVDAQKVVVVDVPLDRLTDGGRAGGYDLVYIAASVDDATLARIVAAHRRLPIVLVCERPGFAAGGGTVQMFVRQNAIRFEVNKAALKQQGLAANSQLLKLSQEAPR